MVIWPARMAAPWSARTAETDPDDLRRAVLGQRAIGALFFVMGCVVAYAGLSANGPDATSTGIPRVASLLFAALWALLGVATMVWPERVRSVTNPNHATQRGLWLAGSALSSYRLTGAGFIVMGAIVAFVILSTSQ